ncbi:MAG: UbiA family prenyltransferase [Candidatus Bathyarchaeia archaeon]
MVEDEMTVKRLLTSFAKCLYSRNVVLSIYAWPALIGYLITSNGSINIIEIFKLIVAVTFVGYFVYFYNDLVDLKDDLRNRELGNPNPAGRPLGSGMVSKDLMIKFIVFSGILGITAAYLINWNVFLIQLFAMALGLVYSTEPFRLKKRFLFKQFTIATGVIIENFTGSLAVGGINIPVLYLAILNVIFIFGVNPLVDLRDVRGDKISGIKTMPVVWGPQMTVRLTIGLLVAIGAANLIGYLNLGFNLAVMMLVFMIIGSLIYVVYPLLKRWDEPVFLASLIDRKIIPLYMTLQFMIFLGFLKI